AEDVKATYARIVWPPEGVSIPRTPLFATVSEINVRDASTIEFKLHEPRPASFMLAAFATGWNVRRVDKEVWVVEKNRDYWNEGLPYLDGIEFYNFAGFSPELGAALRYFLV